RSVLADESTTGETRRKRIGDLLWARRRIGARHKYKSKRRNVRSQGIVRYDGLGDQIGALRFDAWVEVLPVVAVRPAVKGTVLHRREVVGDEVAAEFVAFIDDGPERTSVGIP